MKWREIGTIRQVCIELSGDSALLFVWQAECEGSWGVDEAEWTHFHENAPKTSFANGNVNELEAQCKELLNVLLDESELE